MKRVLPCALWLAACAPGKEAGSSAPTAVRVQTLEKATQTQASRYSGTVIAASRVELAFRLPGYVEWIGQAKAPDGALRELQEGDRVDQGQPLARLRQEDYAQRVSEARAALAEAVAAKQQTGRELERAQRLFGSGSISRAELDAIKAKAQAARARVQGASARVAEAQTAREDAALQSPIEGVVLKKNLEKGALVTPGLPVFSIADTRKVKVLFAVADTELTALKLGSTQVVTTEALKGQQLEGQISRIGAAADPKSRTFEVEVTLSNPKDELKPGMVAALRLSTEGAAGPSTVVPLSAVVRSHLRADGFAVYVVDGGVAHLRHVELGGFLGNAIPVKAGLAEGEQVVVMGATLLSDGMPVQVIP